MVGATGNRFNERIDRRRRAGRRKFPAGFVADEHVLAFEQRTNAPRRQPILRNQDDAPLARLEPRADLRHRKRRLLLPACCRDELQAPDQWAFRYFVASSMARSNNGVTDDEPRKADSWLSSGQAAASVAISGEAHALRGAG